MKEFTVDGQIVGSREYFDSAPSAHKIEEDLDKGARGKYYMQADNIIRFRQEVAAGRAGTQVAYMTTYLNSIERKSETFFDGINGGTPASGRTSVTSPQGTERELDELEGELHDSARGLSDGWGDSLVNGIMGLVRAGVTGIKKNNLHRLNAAQGRQATDEHRQVMDLGSSFMEYMGRRDLVERGLADTSNMVMLRPIVEKHGGSVFWQPASQTAVVGMPGFEHTVSANGPIVNGRMLVDVSFFSENFGIQASHEPGDRFETLLEAVHAWALTYHPKSGPTMEFSEGSEFGSWIYREGRSFVFGRPWPIRGVTFTMPWFHTHNTPVAWIHTHPRVAAGERVRWDGYNFSWQDSALSNYRQFPAFLVSPSGSVTELELGWSRDMVDDEGKPIRIYEFQEVVITNIFGRS